jgi:hypothetical protein
MLFTIGLGVGLDDFDVERELLEDVVDELDRGLLVVPVVDPQHAQPGAVIDRGVLVVLLAGPRQRLDELDVDLHPMAGHWFLVSLPAPVVTLVALRGGESAEIEAVQNPPHPRSGDLDVVVSLQIHRDLVRPEVVVLAQVHDLADHLGGRLMWAILRA